VRATSDPPNRLVSGPARTGSIRAHNLALLLRTVAEAADPPSRAALSTATGLTRASVSSLVDTLVAGGLLVETGVPTRSGVGRPSTGLALDASGPAGLGLELNVDHASALIVDLSGAVRAQKTEYGAGSSGRLASLARDMASTAREQGLALAGAALAVPGLIDSGSGDVLIAPNLGTRSALGARGFADLVVGIGAATALPADRISVENEATLAARAERRAAGPAGPRSFLQISGEVGIGGGLVLDGQIYQGRHGWSGELGHVTVRPGGRPCGCGSDGCLEQYAGQQAILRTAGHADDRAATIAERARAGEPSMLTALAEAGEALGIALAGALNLLDLDAVVLGGLHAELAPWLAGPIESQLRRRLITARFALPAITPSALGGNASVLGAAWSVLDRVIDDPLAYLRDGRTD